MTNQEYQSLCSQYTELTIQDFGPSIDPSLRLTPEQVEAIRREARQELLDAHLPFEYCCQWTAANPELPGLRTSYHWKHQVQAWAEKQKLPSSYIGEGVFTLAAIYKGYKIHRIRKSTGARIGKKVGP